MVSKADILSNFATVKRFLPLFVVTSCAVLCASLALWHSLRRVPLEGIHAVATDGKGMVWAATENGLYQQNAEGRMALKPVPSLTRHPYPSIHALAYDSLASRLWIGAWNKLYCYDVEADRFINLGDTAIYQTVALDIDEKGRLLAKTQKGLYRLAPHPSAEKSTTEKLNHLYYNKAKPTKSFPTLYLQGRPSIYKHALQGVSVLLFVLSIVIIGYVFKAKKEAERHLASLEKPNPKAEKPRSDFAVKAKEVIERHYHEASFNAEQMGMEMAVSRAQLFRKVKSECGQTVNALLTECRMRHAAALLKDGQTVATVALSIGYSDTSSFRRAFVHYYGLTPSQFVSSTR